MLCEDIQGRAATLNPTGTDRAQLNGDGSLNKLNNLPFHEIANIWRKSRSVQRRCAGEWGSWLQGRTRRKPCDVRQHGLAG